MIFMRVTKSVKPAFLDRDDGIRQQPHSQFQKQLIVYSVSECFLIIKKKPLGLRAWKGQLKPRVIVELPLHVSDVRRLKQAEICHHRRVRRGAVQVQMVAKSIRRLMTSPFKTV